MRTTHHHATSAVAPLIHRAVAVAVVTTAVMLTGCSGGDSNGGADAAAPVTTPADNAAIMAEVGHIRAYQAAVPQLRGTGKLEAVNLERFVTAGVAARTDIVDGQLISAFGTPIFITPASWSGGPRGAIVLRYHVKYELCAPFVHALEGLQVTRLAVGVVAVVVGDGAAPGRITERQLADACSRVGLDGSVVDVTIQ